MAIVSLGRGQAMGEVRRVASWRQLFTSIGCDVVEISVAPDRRPHVDGARSVASGHAAPERLAWSGARIRHELDRVQPAVVVAVTTRAYDPAVFAAYPTVLLDQVDSLARSYRDRAAVVPGAARRFGFRALGALHARVERTLARTDVRRVAAGWSEARALGAEWVPNLVDPSLVPAGTEPDTDLLFFGTLRYPPNVDALERLGQMWSRLVAARPGTTALVAGSAPTARVVELCRRHDWALVADFVDLVPIAARARIAVAPLTRVAGIQNKILDAARLDLPQVVTAAAIEGFAPGLPITPATDDAAFVAECVRLLEDPGAAREQVEAMRTHIEAEYKPARWGPWARALVDQAAD